MRLRQILLCLVLLPVLFLQGCKKSESTDTNSPPGGPAPGRKVTVAFLPKSKGNAYFVSCKQGRRGRRARTRSGTHLRRPTTPDPAKQNEIVENWITLGVDVIAAACENRDGISSALRKRNRRESRSSLTTRTRSRMRAVSS
jgi:ABC-type sugar transport system substrate-binding protein